MTRRFLVFALAPFLATPLFADHHTFDGTWVLNAAKSKASGGPSWKSRTLTLSSDGGTRKFRSEGVSADGQKLSGSYDAKIDGKDYPMTGNVAGADAIALREESPTSLSYTLKKAGKVIATGKSTVSADGKTLTITTKGTSADGKPYTSASVYDKK